MNNITETKPKIFKCEQCNFTCSRNGSLTRHIKQVHDKIKDVQCQQCNFTCSTNSQLKAHIKQVHDKIKDFQCEECDYKFSIYGNLQRHIKSVHDKIKDFQCEKCTDIFSSKSHLTRHIKMVHDKIKDFECQLCKYKCSENCTLKIHMKACTGLSNMSKMEQVIANLLDELNIEYIYDESFMDLKSTKGGRLRFDFRIPTSDESYIFIEYDGIYHFKPIKSQEVFENQQENDKIKNSFCKKNGFPLLRISCFNDSNYRADITEFVKECV